MANEPANRRRYHGVQNIQVELRCCVRMVNIRNAMNTIVEERATCICKILVLSCVLLCLTAKYQLSDDGQRRIAQRRDVNSAA